MPEEATQVLAQFAAALTYDQLPDRIKDHCKNLLLDALACALAGHQGEETEQVAALASALAQSSESSVIGGDRLSLAGATLLNGYLITAVTMCDAHRSTMTHVTPGGDPARLGDRRARRRLGARPARGDCRRSRGHDPHRYRARLSGVPRPRLPRTRRARPVRRGGGGRTAARLRRRDHGEGVRSCRQPGRRHVRGVGNPDGKISSVPRRALRPVGGAAGGAEVPGDARVPHRQGRRPLQQLRQRREAGARDRRSRPALGARADRAAALALRLADAGHGDGAVRSSRTAHDRSSRGQDIARVAGADRFRHARQAAAIQRQVRCAHLRSLRRDGDPARPRADARPIRAGPLRRSPAAPLCRGEGRCPARSGPDRRASGGRDRDARRRRRCRHAASMRAARSRTRFRARRSRTSSASMPRTG